MMTTRRNYILAYVSLHDNPTWEHPYYLGEAHKPFRTVLTRASLIVPC